MPQVTGFFGGALSDDGRRIVFVASASGRASDNNAGGQQISRDGTIVLFGSNARNLVTPRPPANVFQIYAKTIGTAGSQ